MKPVRKSPRMPPGLPAWLAKAWMNDEFEFDIPVPPPVKRKPVPAAPVKRKRANHWTARLNWKRRVRKKALRLGLIIAADFEAERKKLLAETLKKQAEYKLELALMEQEEKQQAARKAYYEECQRQAVAYIEKLRKAAV